MEKADKYKNEIKLLELSRLIYPKFNSDEPVDFEAMKRAEKLIERIGIEKESLDQCLQKAETNLREMREVIKLI